MTEDEKRQILAMAKSRVQNGTSEWSDNFDEMEEDVEFYSGKGQWVDSIEKQREDEGRPCLTFNKMPFYIDQITSEMRDKNPAIDVFPTEGNVATADLRIANLAGNKDYSISEVYQGIVRHIEYISNADIAYETGHEHSSTHGLGYYYLTTEYHDDDSFDQDIKIKRVKNWRSALLDPTFEEANGEDCKWGFLFTRIHKDDYKARYSDKNPVSIQTVGGQYISNWMSGEYYLIGNYYYAVPYNRTLIEMSNKAIYDLDDLEQVKEGQKVSVLDELQAQGIVERRRRTVKSNKIMFCKMSGADLLENPVETVWSEIPIIPVFGKELVDRDGKTIYRGAIRHAKDPQRMFNFWRSASIEMVDEQTNSPYILSAKQYAAYKALWDNPKRRPALVYDEDPAAPAPRREAPPQIPVGAVNEAGMADADIQATIGVNLPTGQHPTADQEVIEQNGINSVTFTDNLLRAINRGGKLIIKAIPKVYDGTRVMRIRFPDDTEDFVEINKTVRDEQTGQDVVINDLGVGKYDCKTRVGPSFTTQRQEISEKVFNLLQPMGASNPLVSQVLAYFGIKNMDMPEAEEIEKALKKLLPPGVIELEPGEEPPPQQPPTPQDQVGMKQAEALIADADSRIAKAETDKIKAAAEVEKAQAAVEKANAETAKAQATMLEVVERMDQLEENQRETIAAGIAEYITQSQQP